MDITTTKTLVVTLAQLASAVLEAKKDGKVDVKDIGLLMPILPNLFTFWKTMSRFLQSSQISQKRKQMRSLQLSKQIWSLVRMRMRLKRLFRKPWMQLGISSRLL